MEVIQAVINFVVAHWDQLFEIIGVSAVVAAMTPNTSDDKIVNWILAALNAAGANIGRAKNAE